MKFKAKYDKVQGFHFPELSEEMNYEVYSERRDKKFILMQKGYYTNGLFFLEYSKKLNFILLTWANKNILNDTIESCHMIIYNDIKEALEDLTKLKSIKEDVKFWNTQYYQNDFEQDYIDPNEDYSKMKWRKKGVLWVAQGRYGKFVIKHLHRKYIGWYENDSKKFFIPPNKYISKMKEICQENAYWEG